MIPFLFNENRFSFLVADYLLVGQLCTNHKSDRSLLLCLKMIKCSTNEIRDAPLYNSCSLPIQVMTARTIAGAIRWLVADPGCGSRTWRWPTSPKRPRLGFRRSAMILYPSLTGPPPPPTWACWTTSFGHTSRTSPTWPPTTPKTAWSPPSAEYLPSSCRCLWKRHAPNSGSVLRQWLRLKAATLNRCQLYYIIKLPELIFSIKV